MYRLQGTIRPYAWGSRTAIAQLTGRRSPTERPEAEMWFGAHPGGPTLVADGSGRTLADLIAADPEYHLGSGRESLPFLLKILAADTALSIQAHPSKRQAEEGCAAEDAEGIPRDAPNRCYRDDNHKPELLVALSSPFEALAGFRSVAHTQQLLGTLGGEELKRFCGLLGSGDEAADLRGLVTTWINLPPAVSERVIADVVERCKRLAAAEDEGEPWMRAAAGAIAKIAQQYPKDPGILVALLLNYITLEPGEAIYLDAGQLHAYVSGLGVEIMANSDNVLRGGLTAKHINVPELMRVLVSEPLADPVTRAGADGIFPTPAPDFRLRRVVPGEDAVVAGPAIVLCAGGRVELRSSAEGDEQESLRPGEAVWIAAEEDATRISADDGPGAFVATAG
ncbi:mannose-6-phosphate isomerase, class I [Corynebacterium heidelbergense]|uniref:mannose-6-phosphate isomerase n=1 Tax=Corynebacterium heidelbergense TaxID=2055947 RepID=A0A364V9I6_9CORY|nr:mannose-6-phosphate isomerase, class I [Corynebacterium heidelbergense]RAV33291.1 mannose-6-phosphate isomerase, class I [Corynebacterium heidelbergense]WCZ37195.1 Mannose-6-phosphate isomerase [Corynebacterium heidelbergense]